MTNSQRKKQMSDEIRNRIVSKYETGKTANIIAEELELNKKSVNSILRIYISTGRVGAKKVRAPKIKKIDTDIENLIKSYISNDASITLKTIKEKLLSDTTKIISKSTIARSIDNFNFSFKRIKLIPEARNGIFNMEIRFLYANEYLCLDENKIIFLDEFGVNCSMRIGYGRSIRGTSPRKTVRTIRSKNYSISAAITKKGILYYKVINKAFNSDEYLQFIFCVLNKMETESMTGYTFIMDNCTIHKVASIKSIILNSNNNLLFIPPYSPQLNAIEEFFSKWKRNVKALNSNTVEELQNAINNGHLNISDSDCCGYFNNVRKHALKAIRREEF